MAGCSSVVASSSFAVFDSVIAECRGVGDMPASGPPDWRVVSAADASLTEPGVVRSGGSRGLIVGTPRLIPMPTSLPVSCDVVPAVVAAVVTPFRGLNENGRMGDRPLP